MDVNPKKSLKELLESYKKIATKRTEGVESMLKQEAEAEEIAEELKEEGVE